MLSQIILPHSSFSTVLNQHMQSYTSASEEITPLSSGCNLRMEHVGLRVWGTL
jgi:hypothetical protein